MPEAPFTTGGLDLPALAVSLGLPPSTMRRLVRAGLVPGVGVGSNWFCSPEHLSQWLEASPSPLERRRLRELLAGWGREA